MSWEDELQSYFEAAYDYAESRDFEKALFYFDKVIQIDPSEKEAWFNKGSIYEEINDNDAAIYCFEQAVMHKPNFLEAIAKLGMHYYRKGDFYKAKYWLKKRIDYGHTEAQIIEAYQGSLNKPSDANIFFISYSWEAEKVSGYISSKLLPLLDEYKIEYSIDKERIPQTGGLPELPWQIEQWLAYCTSVLYIWSQYSPSSFWMNLELCSAIAMHKNVIVLSIDEHPLPTYIKSWITNEKVQLIPVDSHMKKDEFIQLITDGTNPFLGVNEENQKAQTKVYSFGGVDFEFVRLKGGILNDYLISKYPITQKQWREIMGFNPSYFKGDDNRPVECVSWNDAILFVNKLNSEYNTRFSLPNDIQWEYACRAGSLGNWCFGDNEDLLFEYAWLVDNTGIGDSPGFRTGQGIQDGFPTTTITIETSPYYTNSVYTKMPNKWGIFHMHGNVWEWCNNASPSEKELRLIRGGSFRSYGRSMRCSSHAYYPLDGKLNDIGFRICQEI